MSVVISIESYTQLDMGLASRVQEMYAQSRHLIATHRLEPVTDVSSTLIHITIYRHFIQLQVPLVS
jgi:hypothetical protein